MNGNSCVVCSDVSVHCQGGYRYNANSTFSERCELCDVKNCQNCDTERKTCDVCLPGYNLTEAKDACNAFTNSTLKPCADGYYKSDSETNGKCMPCKGGCKECTTSTNC